MSLVTAKFTSLNFQFKCKVTDLILLLLGTTLSSVPSVPVLGTTPSSGNPTGPMPDTSGNPTGPVPDTSVCLFWTNSPFYEYVTTVKYLLL